MLNLGQPPSPQSSHYQPAVTALLHSQQAGEGERGAELKVKGTCDVTVGRRPNGTKEGEKEEWKQRDGGDRRKEGWRHGGGGKKQEEGEAQELCSCVSVLNNHFCVRGSTHQQRTWSVVEHLVSVKNTQQCRQTLARPPRGLHQNSPPSPPLLSKRPDVSNTRTNIQSQIHMLLDRSNMQSAESSIRAASVFREADS